MSRQDEELVVHVIITGSRQAGISSFINQRAEDFEANDEVGMGIDIQTTSVDLDGGKKYCTMHFYEVAGTFPLKSLKKVLKKKCGLAVMFDLSNPVSLELAEVLFNRIQNELQDKEMPKHKFLLGSHADLEHKVTREQIDAVLTLMGENTQYLEFSSKTMENVRESLEKIAETILSG